MKKSIKILVLGLFAIILSNLNAKAQNNAHLEVSNYTDAPAEPYTGTTIGTCSLNIVLDQPLTQTTTFYIYDNYYVRYPEDPSYYPDSQWPSFDDNCYFWFTVTGNAGDTFIPVVDNVALYAIWGNNGYDAQEYWYFKIGRMDDNVDVTSTSYDILADDTLFPPEDDD